MTYAIPVVDLERADLQAVRAGTRVLGGHPGGQARGPWS